ncbi:MAG: hypothetical protein A49_06910 [Methyloceanibacter sp.]|nr:MAG: hypothetical protein A49_06910 [Methyloceanibacter sp.]
MQLLRIGRPDRDKLVTVIFCFEDVGRAAESATNRDRGRITPRVYRVGKHDDGGLAGLRERQNRGFVGIALKRCDADGHLDDLVNTGLADLPDEIVRVLGKNATAILRSVPPFRFTAAAIVSSVAGLSCPCRCSATTRISPITLPL